MPRICPNFSERFSRTVEWSARRTRNKRALHSLRELFNPLVIRCPNCNATIRRVDHPESYFLQAALLIGSLGYLYLINNYTLSTPLIDLSLFCLSMGSLLLFNDKWGYRYELADEPDGKPSQ